MLREKKGSNLMNFLFQQVEQLTSVHDSVELHWHANATCAIGGEVQGRVRPALYKTNNQKVKVY